MSVEHASRLVSPQEREQFERDGYLVIESQASERLLDAIVEDVAELYGGEERTENGIYYGARRVRNAWKIRDNVKALALSPTILATLEELYGRKPLAFQTINFNSGTQQAAHSDAIHFGSKPPGYMAGVWVALEDIQMGSGPIVYYPGSHRFAEVTMRGLGLEPGRQEYQGYVAKVAELIDREGLEPSYATIKKGEALIWASNMLHGGAEWTDKSLTRHSQVTHYFFEGCKYYQPLESHGDDISWWTPNWVA
jgi:ectoine hydroxylase-related dioxygenase (phytanoyl-CoA dioxygenase family)